MTMSALFPTHALHRAALALTVAASALLSGCGGLKGIGDVVTPYRAEIVQGNFVSREQVQVLQPGMGRQQVRDILGSPLVTSLFHADRWDYVFLLRRQGIEPQRYHLTVRFKGDVLEKVEGDTMPTETEFVGTLAPSGGKPSRIPALEASPEALEKFEKERAAAPATGDRGPATPAAARTAYPPLEPEAR